MHATRPPALRHSDDQPAQPPEKKYATPAHLARCKAYHTPALVQPFPQRRNAPIRPARSPIFHLRQNPRTQQASDATIAGSAADEISVALRRASTHTATALAIHIGLRHNSCRRLSIGFHVAIHDGKLSRSHLKNFLQANTLAQALQRPDVGGPGKLEFTLRRMRRRFSAFIRAVAALLAGRPRPVGYAKRFLRIAMAAASPPDAEAAAPTPS